MNKVRLCLPVWIVGIPLLACLLLTPVQSGPTPVAELPTVVIVDKGPLPDKDSMATLAATDPIAFLENCLLRYQKEVHGYSLTMQKHERIDNKLNDLEIISVHFREEPHSALLRWQKGARLAEAALYVDGENKGKMLARPSNALARRFAGDVVERDVTGADARNSGRYTLNEYGIKKGTVRTLLAWKAAKEKKTLHVEYLGEEKIKETGDRLCYQLKRTNEPENDGVMELTIYVDKETWLQVGSVLKGKDGKLIAAYYFRDITLNPKFKPNQFTREALKPE